MAVGDFLTWAVQAQDAPAHVARVLQTILLNEGVVDVAGGSFQVQEDTGANSKIQIGSGTLGDLAAIEGDDAAGQGVYVVETQNATVTRDIAASDPSQDRIDLVVLQNYDGEADSSGLNDADVEVIEGTPAPVPTAPALPDSAIPLAEVLVGAGVTAITNANITDTRSEATLRNNLRSAEVDTVSTAESTSSGAFGNLTTIGPTVTVDTGVLALVGVSARVQGDTAGTRASMGFQISGATSPNVEANEDLAFQAEASTANDFYAGTYVALVSLTPGSNTFIAKYASLGAGGSATFRFRRLWVLPL